MIKRIQIDSILLFVFVIPFIMTYRLSPGDTPFWLFGLIFLGLFAYLVLDVFKISESFYFKLKKVILWLLIAGVIGSAIYSAIIVRHKTHPTYMIHDIILQQESAVQFLLHGKNPYSVTYFDTPLAQWHYSDKDINPALYHFVMEPFYLLFAVPFYLLFGHTVGFFDGRIPLFFLFFSLLYLAGRLVKNNSNKLLFIVLLAFNPSMLGYTLEGRSDVFMFAFLFIALFLLHKNKYFWGGIFMSLAFLVKQSAWPMFPFYVAFLYFKTKSVAKTLKAIIPFLITILIIAAPFLVWNARAFLESTIGYLSGSVAHSYPVSGYGWGMVLNQLGVIRDVYQYYPFWIWQLAICLPLLIILVLYLKKAPTVNRLVFSYGIFLFVFWYFSRYFNNSHLGYLSMVFITAYFWPKEN